MQNRGYFKTNICKACFLLILLIFIGMFFVEVDYYLVMPGDAEHIRPIIQVEDMVGEESGRFLFTTVTSVPGNLLFYSAAKITNNLNLTNIEFKERQEVLGHFDMDDDLYRETLLLFMSQSQQEAIYNAFRLAGKKANFIEKAVIVQDVSPESNAKDILRPGDIIRKIDENYFVNSEQIINYVSNLAPGDIVNVVYQRDEKEYEAEIILIKHPEHPEQSRIGIMIMTDTELDVEQEVLIDTGKIGGSSAGLMFTLEILNQLTEEDITNGLIIAGTGTIDADGNVGQIGGVKHKVVAANKRESDVFFVPADINSYDNNWHEAVIANEKLGGAMQIIPVSNIEEAVDYLYNIGAIE